MKFRERVKGGSQPKEGIGVALIVKIRLFTLRRPDVYTRERRSFYGVILDCHVFNVERMHF